MPTADGWSTLRDVLHESLRDNPEFTRHWRSHTPGRVFSIWLTKHRVVNRLTQSRLARQLGVSQQLISRFEAEDRNPDIDTLIKLATALGLSITITIGPNVIGMKIVDPTFDGPVEDLV